MDVAHDLETQDIAFALEYMIDYDYTRAAKHVGLTKAQGRALSNDPKVKRYILACLGENAQASLITEQYIQANYLRIMPMLLGDEEVPMVVQGVPVEAKQFEPAAALAALRDMAKSTNFVKNPDVDKNNISVTVNIANLVGDD